ncbi:hypothetical protein [Paractinoplanes atraurantiacus]|uniref:Uncharacterized protein n=1 Tax=Paractinoplanes atraurantiacus TaxID=1036182 RepID=A0A285H055_9ACTN|nr:hypothetical protein [Actinoplanes atraurantiacus]SNY29098.1 hypothetical protein SAMN05421748_103191 [Actinoplanes atraurantiacus]
MSGRAYRSVRLPVYVVLVWVVVGFVSPILAVVAAVKISSARAADQQAQITRALCAVVVTMDDAYRETPASTAAGRNLQASIAELRHGLRCPE